MAVNDGGAWPAWLQRIEQQLGDEYIEFAQRISGAGVVRTWEWQDDPAWLSYAMRAWTNAANEQIRRRNAVGLFVEPRVFVEDGEAIERVEPAMVELAVRLQLAAGQRPRPLLRDLRAQLALAFGDQIADVDYPSAAGRPRDRVCIHNVVAALGSDWTDERGVWISIVPSDPSLDVASATIRDGRATDAEADAIAADLRRRLGQFIAVVEFVRGWLSPARVVAPSRIAWIGWLGEYAARRVAARALGTTLTELPWLGRGANADFRNGALSLEVKSSITGLPRTAYFTANELQLARASGTDYGLVRVALDPTAVDAFVRAVVENNGGDRPQAPLRVLTRMSADLGLPWPWVDSRARVIRAALAEFMASNPVVEEPQWEPFGGDRYANLRRALDDGTLVEGWIRL